MGKNKSASNLVNVIDFNNDRIAFVSGSTTLMSISSSGAITVTGVISGSNAQSASYAINTSYLNNSGSGEFVPTGSFNTFSSSILTYTGSANSRFSSLETTSGSNITRIAALETASGSAITRLNAIEVVTGSNISRLSSIEAKTGSYATTGSNIFVGSQTITGSILGSGSLSVNGCIVSTGQIVAQTINVQQVTSSIVYSCGSNIFGCAVTDTQQMTGSVRITGSLNTVGTICSIGNTCFGGMSVVASCLGIGTATPLRTLHVRGGNGTAQIESTGNNSILYFGDVCSTGIDNRGIGSVGNDLWFMAGGLERVRFTSAGIACFSNTVCAPTLVACDGTIFLQRGANTCNGLIIGEQGGTISADKAAVIRTAGGTSHHLFLTPGIDANTNACGYIRLGGDRYTCVGINSAPTYTMHIQGFGDHRLYHYNCGNTSSDKAVIQAEVCGDTSGNAYFAAGKTGVAWSFGRNTTTGNFEVRSNWDLANDTFTRFQITSTGIACFRCQVCVPTLSVGAGAIIYGSTGIGCMNIITATGVNEQDAIILDKAGGYGQSFIRSYYTNVPNYGMAFRAGAGVTAMYIQCQGYVGIGTNSPGAPLHVVGNEYIAKSSGGGTYKQVVVGQTTAASSGVAKKIAYVGFTHSVRVYVWVNQSTAHGSSATADMITLYGSNSTSYNATNYGNVTDTLIAYNNGGSPAYTVDVTLTYSGTAPTINYVIEGINWDNNIYTL